MSHQHDYSMWHLTWANVCNTISTHMVTRPWLAPAFCFASVFFSSLLLNSRKLALTLLDCKRFSERSQSSLQPIHRLAVSRYPIMRFFIRLVASATFLTQAAAKTLEVNVGQLGIACSPNTTQASVGDTIHFNFYNVCPSLPSLRLATAP